MDVILYLLIALIALCVLLLSFPVKIHVKARVTDQTIEHDIRINWFGITVNPEKFSRAGKKKEETKAEKGKERKKKDKKSKTSFPAGQIPQLLRPSRKLLCDLWKAIDFSSMKINAVFGFDNPANTGIACGFIHAAASAASPHIPGFSYRISPVFHEEKIDVSLSSTIRIKPRRVALAILRLLYSSDGRKVIRLMWKMRSE